MADRESDIEVRVLERISDINRSDWDECAGADNPFLCHDFLSSLEESLSVSAEEGWLPRHIVANDPNGVMAAAMPLYLKGHSQGEYVFDHSWAHAWEKAGGQYYPKLLSAVPFTPVTGKRFLVRPGLDLATYENVLVQALLKVVEQTNVATLHVNFLTRGEWERMGSLGFLQRSGQQFHWTNANYQTFQDFLDALSSRKRKNIKKEREAVYKQGVKMSVFTGDSLRTEHWDAFYRFYRNTTDKKWGWDYLKRPFFSYLHERMPDRVALVMAEYEGEWVAGALNLIGSDTLYGRNWGCSDNFKNLHFEACYYQAIEFAIERGLKRVEAGAQGQHKLQRGYLPTQTYSIHYIVDPNFRRAVEDFLERELEAVGEEIEFLEEFSPFKKVSG
ncbi:MAG: GNAT family N-acetyltransferase [Alphaproteobacteria bacterium]